jgi:murein DD-endopeptidase MepM/ murein hydrolase activator NlpD
MKKYILWLLILFVPTLNLARQYPVEEVTINNCLRPYEEPCTFTAPRITGANYTAVQDDPRYRRIYKVLWWSTYTDGRDVTLWSHKWVDIASAAWTLVYAMGSGIVIEAGRRWNRGNLVIIEHTLGDKKIWSSYAHLGEVLIRKGDAVDEGDVIGEIWDSGNSFWPHVQRQLDINQTGPRPYHPSACGEDLEWIVNEWRCRNLIVANTIDPILFVETQGKSLGRDTNDSTQSTIKDISISLTGFAGGYTQINTTKILKILSQTSEDIDEPITITSVRGNLDIFPNKVLFLGNQRSIFVTAQKAGLDIIQIKQWDTILQTTAVIVDIDKTFRISNDAIVNLWQSFTR